MSEQLLAVLADGLFHSGRALGEQIGVSRAAVWKQIEGLQRQGLVFESIKGKGYRWINHSPLLSQSQLRAAGLQIDVCYETDSTNQQALQAVSNGAEAGYTVVAESQSSGRGRRGRAWLSPLAQNLYVSTIYRSSDGASALQGLSLVVGISLAQTLKEALGLDCKLKWPNDIWVRGKKLGGILVELQGDLSGDCAAVIGWGVNVNQLPGLNSEAIDQPWTSLMLELGRPLERNALLERLVRQLNVDLSLLKTHGWAPFQERWLALDGLVGSSITVAVGNRSIQGVAQGVDQQGALLLRTDDGIEHFHGGEVSVRVRP